MENYAVTILQIEKRKVESDVDNLELQKEMTDVKDLASRANINNIQNILRKRIDMLQTAIIQLVEN